MNSCVNSYTGYTVNTDCLTPLRKYFSLHIWPYLYQFQKRAFIKYSAKKNVIVRCIQLILDTLVGYKQAL